MCLNPLTPAQCCRSTRSANREGARPNPVESCGANQTRAGVFLAKRSTLCVGRQSCGSKGSGVKEAGAESLKRGGTGYPIGLTAPAALAY